MLQRGVSGSGTTLLMQARRAHRLMGGSARMKTKNTTIKAPLKCGLMKTQQIPDAFIVRLR
ncbi:MAG: hypothetical protein DMG06_04005 [Acidobacteria bacterium]|nr:MAG: hypothetical protein DMG06_04005 [Acidobacteriota bacterium]